VRKGKSQVTEEELEEAIDKVMITAGHKLNVAGMNLSRVPDLDVKLDDLKGVEEAKAEAAEVIAMLKNIKLVEKFGLKPSKGILLVGPPGTGKTMLAKAIANEAGIAFYSLSGGDFQSMWAGVGSNRVKAVYERARRSGKPAIVFIDEIDAIGGKRGEDLGGGAIQDANKTLNSLLVEMDGFGKTNILTIGATNSMHMLDSALLRPGRFDRHIDVPLPNLEGREAILNKYLEKFKVSPNVQVMEIARMTFLQAGADLANMVNEAGLMAIREGRVEITHSDMVRAIQRVSFGMSRSQHIGVKELFETAYHEAGHTIVSYFRNRKERIQVVTIVPTGRALGYMWSVEKEDRFVSGANKQDYLVDIEVSLGGYVAESLYMDTTTSGVSQDLINVGNTARRMIKNWGMGSFPYNTLHAHGDARGHGQYDGWGVASPETEREIELEIKKTVEDCLQNVRNLLRDKRKELDQIAHALVEKETLFYKDLVNILEPGKSEADINKEIDTLSERKLVGTPPIVNLEFLPGLTQVGPGSGPSNAENNRLTDLAQPENKDPENFRPEN
jgi:cell division protease FtsH